MSSTRRKIHSGFLNQFFGKIDYYKDKILEISIKKIIFLFIITLFTLTPVHFLLFMYGFVYHDNWLHNLLISASMGAIANDHRKQQNQVFYAEISQLYAMC